LKGRNHFIVVYLCLLYVSFQGSGLVIKYSLNVVAWNFSFLDHICQILLLFNSSANGIWWTLSFTSWHSCSRYSSIVSLIYYIVLLGRWIVREYFFWWKLLLIFSGQWSVSISRLWLSHRSPPISFFLRIYLLTTFFFLTFLSWLLNHNCIIFSSLRVTPNLHCFINVCQNSESSLRWNKTWNDFLRYIFCWSS
jgi:hypothetical protein